MVEDLNIHFFEEIGDCKIHRSFYFLSDKTLSYRPDDNKTHLCCICLDCGKLEDYVVTLKDYPRIVYPNILKFNFEEYAETKEKYDILRDIGMDEEEAVSTINREKKQARHKTLK